MTASADIVKLGTEHYSKYCSACHGTDGQTRGSAFPDLRRTPLPRTQQGFDQVVLQGVRAHIVSRATELKNAPPREQPQQAHEDQTQ